MNKNIESLKKCNVICNPDCIFKNTMIKIDRELKFMRVYYVIFGVLSFWKIMDLIKLLFN